ncbi:hypothetical protein SETIT_2G309400v2 [Setaria italica]|uniref:Fatty acyl-CoA reductase n=1 Tax=Setaria italica TaxID=4555 RepID=K4A286_SETIT|nr:hypothetical protein SETIT_2G309400v2 [Setaria italica]
MDATKVAGCFMDRTILVTGSTGFLGKLLVEKILRVEPGVKKLYLLVVGKELFVTLQQIHGDEFSSFIQEKISPVAGDIIHEDLGLHRSKVKQLSEEIDIIVNGAAITNFYERYDVALACNALGTKNVCQFAKQCAHLRMLLHVSTAYVLTGEQEGLLPEKLIRMGETPKPDCHLDIEAELELVHEVKATLTAHSVTEDSSQQLETKAMMELGLKRAKYFGWPNVYVFTKAMGEMFLGSMTEDLPVVIVRPSIVTSTFEEPFPGWIEGTRTFDVLIVGYDKQTVPCFIGDRNGTIDAIPGDMVVNSTMVAMAAHYGDKTQVIYHVTSANQNPLPCYILEESTYAYFFINPRVEDETRTVQHKRLLLFNRYPYFHAYMVLGYKIPLQMLYLVNLLLGGLFSELHNKLNRDYNFFMLLAKLYAPFAFFKACFDDTNLRKLWRTTGAGQGGDGYMFNFDPNCINWRLYLFNTHIPAVLKISRRKKAGRA